MKSANPTRTSLLKIGAILLCLPAYCASTAQLEIATNVKDAPFTATTTVVRTTRGETTTIVGIMARKSDGSVYETLGDNLVMIKDLARHTNFTLYPKRNMYVTIPLDIKADIRPTITVEQYLKQQGGAGAKRSIGNSEITVIGLRQIEGVDTVGIESDSSVGTIERWYSPALDLNIETTSHQSALVTESHATLSQIHLGEPDPKLFEIPAGYVEDKSAPKTFAPIK